SWAWRVSETLDRVQKDAGVSHIVAAKVLILDACHALFCARGCDLDDGRGPLAGDLLDYSDEPWRALTVGGEAGWL
ncbi:hypothetical protein, partial [Escherichia coli]|uniref:hypothetical protein n=1 Tax=Escherichia coli TaxID=562 RepID=UPI001953A794